MAFIDCLKESNVTLKQLVDLAVKHRNDEALLNKKLTEVSEAAELRKNQAKLQRKAQKRILEILEPYEGKTRRKAVMDLMDMTGVRGWGIPTLTGKIDAVLSPVHSQLADMMEAYRPKKLGFSMSKDGQRKMIRAIFGEEILDVDARAYAQSWQKVTEMLRQRFNKAGGGIVKLEDWNLPQSHDSVKISRTNFEEWYEFTRQRIKSQRILPEVSEKTGKKIDATEREEIIKKVLRSVYNNLKTDGVMKVDTSPLRPFVRRKIGNRHQQHRLLHYKDANSWIEYSDRFGGPDYFNTMMGYSEMMAREIGAMEMFGPNPDAMVDRLIKSIPGLAGRQVKNTYDEIMGRNYGFTNNLSTISQGLRSIQVGTKLGGAAIPAAADTFFTALTSALVGLPVLRTSMRAIANLAPATNKANRVTLNKIGLLGEYALNKSRATNRLSEVWGYGATARFADMIIRASGLNYWTTAVKDSFQLEFMANLAELSGRRWQALPRRIRNSLQRYDINPSDWDIIRTSKKYERNGVRFVDLNQIGDEDALTKTITMIKEEANFAVPEPTAKSKAILHQGTERGTVIGEMMRFFGQFKAFPISILASHFHRGLNLKGATRMTYLGSLIAGSTAIGMAVMQAKDILKGKTPRDIDASLVYDGMIQGGAAGLVGDFLLNDPNSFGGMPGAIVGPVLDDVDFLHKLLFGTAEAVMDTEKDVSDRLAAAGVQVARKYTPGQLWYTKLAIERFMLDPLDKNLNSNWYKRQRRLTKRMKKEKGQEWWSKPGTTDINF